jgi:hypothetical protein
LAGIDCLQQEVVEFERRERVRGGEKGGLAARPERRTTMTSALTLDCPAGRGAKWSAPLEAAPLDRWSSGPEEDTDHS